MTFLFATVSASYVFTKFNIYETEPGKYYAEVLNQCPDYFNEQPLSFHFYKKGKRWIVDEIYVRDNIFTDVVRDVEKWLGSKRYGT